MNTAITNTNRSLRFPIVAAALMATAFCLTSARTGSSVHADSAHAEQTASKAVKSQTVHRQHWFQFGRASWYGHALQGLPTATGEAYDMNAMTCAHRTLPLGSLVRVTNLRNHRSLVLRVNDRGPMVETHTRVVDLSYAAAKRLGFSHQGTVRVRLDLVDTRPTRTEVAMLTKPAM